MDNILGTSTNKNVGNSRNGKANEEIGASSRPVAISTARPIHHPFDCNYRAYVEHHHDDGNVCCVKRRTDPRGGTKFYLASNSLRGNHHGYPDYRRCLSVSPTSYFELSEIPTTELWTPFWNDMVRAQEKGDNNTGFLIVGGFAALLCTTLSAVYFFSNAAPQSIFWSRTIPPSFMVFFLVFACCCVSDTHREWRRVIEKHQPDFQAVGYRVDLLIETTGPPNHKSISPKCYVCHIRKNTSSHKSSPDETAPA